MSAHTFPSNIALDSDQEEASIRLVLERLDDAWNEHDARAFAEPFCEDADFTNVRGMQAHGRAGVERFMEPLFATMFADSEQRILSSTSRFLTKDLAAVDAWWTMDGALTPYGQLRPTRYGLASLVMRKDPDCWRILLWHNMELEGPPPEDPSTWRPVIFHHESPPHPPLGSHRQGV